MKLTNTSLAVSLSTFLALVLSVPACGGKHALGDGEANDNLGRGGGGGTGPGEGGAAGTIHGGTGGGGGAAVDSGDGGDGGTDGLENPCDGLNEEQCFASDYSGPGGTSCRWVRGDLMSYNESYCDWGSDQSLCTLVVPETLESCVPAPSYPACNGGPMWNAGTYWRKTPGGAIAIAQLGCDLAPLSGWTACEGASPDEPPECECWCFMP